MVDNGKNEPPTVLIAWGWSGPFFTEVTYEEEPRIVREFEGFRAQRGHLHHWEGSSAERPRLLLCSDANTLAAEGLERWTVHFSFNGVTGITKWRLHIGADMIEVLLSRHLIERTKKAFEEIISLQELIDTMAARNVTLTTDRNTTDVALYVRVVPIKGDRELLRGSKALKVPMVVSSRDESSGAVTLSPPSQPVLCGCYQPDIGLRKHLARPKANRESTFIDMAAVEQCAESCVANAMCQMFFYFENTGECEVHETNYLDGEKLRMELHSVPGVVSGLKECLQHDELS
mmetsp:Transcript_17962/g.51088  ORF Transcript_17962/g.51088 Transcript_17962/m.51088 type:complete len:289 (-) Transcript_17962:195-1061(-)